MSIKDELKYFKDELSSDEKLLENAFKIERFYKKYKIRIWISIILLIGGFAGKTIFDFYNEYRLNVANDALLSLKSDSKDKEALSRLKEFNPKLYTLYQYSKSVKAGDISTLKSLPKSNDALLSDLTKYHIDVLEKRPGTSRYYKDLSIVEKAYADIKSGNVKKAKERLSLIGVDSPLTDLADLLKHSILE